MKNNNSVDQSNALRKFKTFFKVVTSLILSFSLIVVWMVIEGNKKWHLSHNIILIILLGYLCLIIFYGIMVIHKWRKTFSKIVGENVFHLKQLFYLVDGNSSQMTLINKHQIDSDNNILYTLDGSEYSVASLNSVYFELEHKVIDGIIYLFLLIKDISSNQVLSMYELSNEWYNFIIETQVMRDDEMFTLMQNNRDEFVRNLLK